MKTAFFKHRVCGAGIVLAGVYVTLAQTPSTPRPLSSSARTQPGAYLSVDELKTEMFHVSDGRSMKPRVWANGAKMAVALTFNVDNAVDPLNSGILGSEPLSRGEYGAIDGLPRILRLLDKEDVPASFYIPAVSAALHPHMITDIESARQKHEIGVRGWIDEDLIALDDEARELELLKKSIDFLVHASGKRPVGYRAPGGHFSKFTMKQIKEAGFLYDTSLLGSDNPYEILLDGAPTGVIELPVERILEDAPYFGAANGSLPSPELVVGVFQSEFDVAYGEGGLLVLTMHPEMMGHRSRIASLEKLILYMKSKPGVWFATEEQIARYVASTGKAN